MQGVCCRGKGQPSWFLGFIYLLLHHQNSSMDNLPNNKASQAKVADFSFYEVILSGSPTSGANMAREADRSLLRIRKPMSGPCQDRQPLWGYLDLQQHIWVPHVGLSGTGVIEFPPGLPLPSPWKTSPLLGSLITTLMAIRAVQRGSSQEEGETERVWHLLLGYLSKGRDSLFPLEIMGSNKPSCLCIRVGLSSKWEIPLSAPGWELQSSGIDEEGEESVLSCKSLARGKEASLFLSFTDNLGRERQRECSP